MSRFVFLKKFLGKTSLAGFLLARPVECIDAVNAGEHGKPTAAQQLKL